MNSIINLRVPEITLKHIIPNISIRDTVTLSKTCSYYKKIIIDNYKDLWNRTLKTQTTNEEFNEINIYQLIQGINIFASRLKQFDYFITNSVLVNKTGYKNLIDKLFNESLGKSSKLNLDNEFEVTRSKNDLVSLNEFIHKLGKLENSLPRDKVDLFPYFLLHAVSAMLNTLFIAVPSVFMFILYKVNFHPTFSIYLKITSTLFTLLISILGILTVLRLSKISPVAIYLNEYLNRINPKLLHYIKILTYIMLAPMTAAVVYTVSIPFFNLR